MAGQLRIFPILSTQLQFSVSQPIFEPLAAAVLGNAATPADGFDADLLAVAQQLDSETNAIASADLDLAAADFTPGDFAASNIDPIVQDTGAFTGAGDSVLQELDDSVVQQPAEPPTASQGCFPVGSVGNVVFENIVFPGEVNVDLLQIAQGNCTTIRHWQPRFGMKIPLFSAVRLLAGGDASIQSVAIAHDVNSASVPFDSIEITVSGGTAGTFKADIVVTQKGTGLTCLAHLTLGVVAQGGA